MMKNKKTKITFHSGVLTIGGTIIEIEYEDSHIFFDFGSEFNPSASVKPSDLQGLLDNNLVPYLDNIFDTKIPLKGYKSKENKFKYTAVFLSHIHLDHSKIVNYLRPEIPLYTLEGTKSLINTLNINDNFIFPLYQKQGSNTREVTGVKENEIVTVGKIKVKVMPVDHDAYGACGLLIETPEMKIAYSGDLRLHGYREKDTLNFCKESKNCDVLLIEGVSVSFQDFGEKLRSKRLNILAVALLIAFILIVIYSYNTQKKYRQSIENNYNMAFFQLVDYVQDVEVYLAKSVISNSPESGAETLTYIWREANLAQTYLSMLPMNSVELENTAKFLNQVSDYSYSLSRKTINNTQLSQEDLDNLDKLHDYSLQLENTLNQLSLDINDGRITWGELTNKAAPAFAKQVSNISQDSFGSLEENFHEYAGLIYDGAYSEHMTNPERRGLTGDNIDEETAKNKVEEFISKDKIKKIESNGLTENANIQTYDFIITTINDEIIWVSISQKGGHIISMNYNRDVTTEILSQEDIDKIAQNFLEEKSFKNMKKTYFTKRDGIETINFAYEQDNVIVYPDLIKVKIALDNGEILGIETTGYLNSHTQRTMSQIKVSKEEAKAKINKNLQIESERLAIIPTEFQTEIMCWEFKGRVDDREFLVYINVETGKEEDILVILNSDEGTLTM